MSIFCKRVMSKIKKTFFYLTVPFVYAWIILALIVFLVGESLSWIGDAMSGRRIGDAIRRVW